MPDQTKGPLGYEIMAIRRTAKTVPYQRQQCPVCEYPLEVAIDEVSHCVYCGWHNIDGIFRNTPKP